MNTLAKNKKKMAEQSEVGNGAQRIEEIEDKKEQSLTTASRLAVISEGRENTTRNGGCSLHPPDHPSAKP